MAAGAAVACGRPSPERPASDSGTAGAPGAAAATPTAADGATPAPAVPRWSAVADSLERFVVLAPAGETSFVAASRAKRLLLDLGRMDLDVRKDSARSAAFREVVRVRAPVREGGMVLLRGAWGSERATVTGFEYYNARIVAVLQGSATADSLAREKAPMTAAAFVVRAGGVDSVAPTAAGAPAAVPDSTAAGAAGAAGAACARRLSSSLAPRVQAVRDSLLGVLRGGPQPPYERLRRTLRTTSSAAPGCFGGAARVALAAQLRSGEQEWVRELVVLVDTLGAVTPLSVSDLRFRAHELLHALDADGDGVDDLATRATTERAGATTILRLDRAKRRLERLAAGFAWETF